MRPASVLPLLLAALAGCGEFPKDSAGTLLRVRGGEMRVGVAERPPWVRYEGDRVVGVEPKLVEAFARRLGARVRWVRGSTDDLVEALHRRELDLMAAGLAGGTAHEPRLALSQPYLKTELRIGGPPEATPPTDWSGHRVAVDAREVALAALVREEGAEPVTVTAAESGQPAMKAGYDFQLAAQGLRLVGPELATEERVLAVSQGESAFLLALDRHLSAVGEAEIRAMAASRAGGPMKPTSDFEFPPEQQEVLAKARRLEWLTLGYLMSAAALMYLTMGASQAMRTSFVEDLLSLIPAAAFLICTRVALWPPSERFPFGLHGAVSIGYLVASLALFAVGFSLVIEAVSKVLGGERTTIGGMRLFGHTVWAGWPMLAALVYATIPSVLLGRAKLRLAPQIHDKILFADAQMMKADWMTAVATGIGVLGVGFGYWWMDPLMAALVSLDILKDGATNLWVATADLVHRRPQKTDRTAFETLPADLKRRMEALDWVERADVRLRESGHVFFGDVYLVPRSRDNLPARIDEALDEALGLDWRLHDITIMVVDDLDRTPR